MCGMAFAFAVLLAVSPVGTWSSARSHLTLTYPPGWHITTTSLTPITQPVQRVAVYSGGSPRPMGPPKRGQVIGIVMEQTDLAPRDLSRFPARPTHFRVAHLGGVEGFNSGRTGRWGEIVFRDHGRGFYVFIGVGAGAASQLRPLLVALDSLRVGS
jgi:hypothetical protein